MMMCSNDDNTPTPPQDESAFEKVEKLIADLREKRSPFPVSAKTGSPHLPYIAARCGVPEYLLKTVAIRSAFDVAMNEMGTQPLIILSSLGLKLANLITVARRKGEAIPLRKDKTKPCFKTIAQQTGIASKTLQHNKHMRKLLRYWQTDSQDLQAESCAEMSPSALGEAWSRDSKYPNKKGTTYVTVATPELVHLASSAVAPPREPFRDLVMLKVYIETLAKSSTGVPALTGRSSCAVEVESDDAVFGRLNLPAISNDCRFGSLVHLDREPFKTILIEGARRLGVTEYFTSKVSIKTFRTEAVEKRRREVADGKSPKSAAQQASNTNSALTAFVAASGLREEDTMEELFFSSEYESYLHVFRSRFTNHLTGKKQDVELRRLREYAIAMRRLDGLPVQFSAALAVLIKKAELTVSDVARLAEIDRSLVMTWCAGGQPASSDRGVLHRLENALQVPANTLQRFLERRREVFATDDVLTDEVKDQFAIAGVPLSILPHDWSFMPRQEKVDSLKWVFENIIDAEPYSLYLRKAASEGKIHEKLKGFMMADYTRLSHFKTDEIPDPVIARGKTSRGRGHGKTTSGVWKGTTEKKVEAGLARLCTGLLTASVEHAADGPSYVHKQGLGYLANSSCVRAAFDRVAKRRFEMLDRCDFFALTNTDVPQSKRVYTSNDASLCQIIAGFFHNKTGYFHYARPKVGEIPGLVDREWLSKAEKDWPSVAQNAYDELTRLADSMEKSAEQIRDPWRRIEPLLDRDDPLTPLFDALEENAKGRPGIHAGPLALAKHHRRHLIFHLLVAARLRAGNVRKLTWNQNNKGQLRKDKRGNWCIVIEQRHIKNEGSSALPAEGEDLVIELDPSDKLLHETLDDYLLGQGATRNALCPNKKTDLVFPGKLEDKPYDASSFSKLVAGFVTEHLVYTPWSKGGIKGVLPFGPHAIRHLIATHVIKATGLAEAAANAIFDTLATVMKTYARWLSVDKSRLSNQIIRNSVQSGKKRSG